MCIVVILTEEVCDACSKYMYCKWQIKLKNQKNESSRDSLSRGTRAEVTLKLHETHITRTIYVCLVCLAAMEGKLHVA